MTKSYKTLLHKVYFLSLTVVIRYTEACWNSAPNYIYMQAMTFNQIPAESAAVSICEIILAM